MIVPASESATQPPGEGEMQEWRCYRCRRLLAIIAIRRGWIEIKCKSCQTVNVLYVTPTA